MNQYFDDRLLQGFMESFYGYGNYEGAYWFIGMEEGGGDSFDEVSKRLQIWKERGRNELEDVADYHQALGMGHLFVEEPKLQPTWGKLIRILSSIEGKTRSIDDIKQYQQQEWARRNGSICSLELLPLPSPSTSQWLYGKHSKLSYLRDRKSYRKMWSSRRAHALKKRISTHQPQAVIFYSFSYLQDWISIAGIELNPVLSGTMYAEKSGNSLYAVVKHPAARGVTNEYFHEVGRFIRLVLSGKLDL